jgi:hypothetical protein
MIHPSQTTRGASSNNRTRAANCLLDCRQHSFLDVGAIDPSRMRTIMLAYVSAFFDQELRGARSELLVPGSKRFPEAPLVITH